MKKVLTVTMDGIRYHASRPADCRHCFFWKNRKKGCVLGKENCYGHLGKTAQKLFLYNIWLYKPDFSGIGHFSLHPV